jgi:hypothetical protein
MQGRSPIPQRPYFVLYYATSQKQELYGLEIKPGTFLALHSAPGVCRRHASGSIRQSAVTPNTIGVQPVLSSASPNSPPKKITAHTREWSLSFTNPGRPQPAYFAKRYASRNQAMASGRSSPDCSSNESQRAISFSAFRIRGSFNFFFSVAVRRGILKLTEYGVSMARVFGMAPKIALPR